MKMKYLDLGTLIEHLSELWVVYDKSKDSVFEPEPHIELRQGARFICVSPDEMRLKVVGHRKGEDSEIEKGDIIHTDGDHVRGFYKVTAINLDGGMIIEPAGRECGGISVHLDKKGINRLKIGSKFKPRAPEKILAFALWAIDTSTKLNRLVKEAASELKVENILDTDHEGRIIISVDDPKEAWKILREAKKKTEKNVRMELIETTI